MSQGDQPRDLHDVSSDDPHPPVNPDSGGGDGGGTDARLRAIEMRLVKVETKLESFATKEDIQKLATQMAEMESSMLRWFISAVIAIVLLVASLDRLLPW